MKELSTQPKSLANQTLSPDEIAHSILLVFKSSIKQAGSLSEQEYRMMYDKTEGQLKTYLHHLVELTNPSN